MLRWYSFLNSTGSVWSAINSRKSRFDLEELIHSSHPYQKYMEFQKRQSIESFREYLTYKLFFPIYVTIWSAKKPQIERLQVWRVYTIVSLLQNHLECKTRQYIGWFKEWRVYILCSPLPWPSLLQLTAKHWGFTIQISL